MNITFFFFEVADINFDLLELFTAIVKLPLKLPDVINEPLPALFTVLTALPLDVALLDEVESVLLILNEHLSFFNELARLHQDGEFVGHSLQ